MCKRHILARVIDPSVSHRTALKSLNPSGASRRTINFQEFASVSLLKVLTDRTHRQTRGGIFVSAVIHHFAQPKSVGFGHTNTDHGSAMRRFLTDQNVHRDSVIVLPEREWE